MNNVIEYIWNPIATVTECYRILSDPAAVS